MAADRNIARARVASPIPVHETALAAVLLPRSFCLRLARTTLEGIQFGELHSQAQRLHPAWAEPQHAADSGTHPSAGAGNFYVHLQLEGESVHRQHGREARLQPGDFTLCDGSQSYEIEFVHAGRQLLLAIPQSLLRRHLSCPEDVVAVLMPGHSGLSALLSSFLRDLWRQCRQMLEALADSRVMHAMLELLASAYAGVSRGSSDRGSVADAQRARILDYMEAHLREPDLTPMKVARACGITPRYLHHLFSSQTETVARYILRRRLEECSLAMSDPVQRSRTVTAIAFERGFNSTTHFGRVFRARYGMTPREYRQRHFHG